MGGVKVKFDGDDRTNDRVSKVYVTLKPRCETIVQLPTLSDELESGLVIKTELAPGVIVADILTVVREGTCLASIVNVNDQEIKISLPVIKLEPYEVDTMQINNVSTRDIETTERRIQELRKMVRTDHLNDVERRSNMKICEDYNIFHLPGDKLSVTTAAEHNSYTRYRSV
jgi:hypothetical protein